ncbi:putative prolipoprotein diacylglyceryl transferase [Alkalihalophilus pseudofirmus OF4]|uniref:Prolipoprotein diacylglyceryl transferase n=1 Tax=Alkalihalophilus pseudofirmus (strain ATCC BAA-2126 / JCM 17055 / OF4) TaxID=398511 RepID=D3FXX1_ALKPO|nr:hypothetical protein [Alkalihalophilus pseudofirmus]ADC50730.1 putative prolipoprotein diacylglyceryl transferase [Alkalihalophilus pseudofirmus OF4]
MNEVWSVGPFIVRQSWVALIVIVLLGYYLANQFFYEMMNSTKKDSEVFWNGFFAFFVTFQFSKLILNPAVAIGDPIAVLATPSGANEWMLAWVVMCVYLWWSTKEDAALNTTVFIKIAGTYLIIETMYYAVFPFNTMEGIVGTNVILMGINTLALLFIYIQSKRQETHTRMLGQFLILFGLIKGLLSFFIPIRMLDYSVPSWFYFMYFIAGLIILSNETKRKEVS